MTKKALCVGINDYPGDINDLRGCVNDANAWADTLISDFEFPSSAVKILTEAQATKAAVLDALHELLAGAQPEDVLVFTNSSHGTYLADTSRDEPGFDEALCPYDAETNLIVDDELRLLFKAHLPKGVHFTAIFDSCHSGTATRLLNFPAGELPPYRRARFLDPTVLGNIKLPDDLLWRLAMRAKHPQSRMKEVLIAGCKDTESSYDALIDGNYHGAMTYYALQAIRASNCKLTYDELHRALGALLEVNEFDQHPQLEGRLANKKRQVFS